jgi:hypothetical protein
VGSLSSYDDIIGYIAEGLTVKTIASRAGMNELAARRLVYNLVEQHGLTYTPTVSDITTFGLTNQTHPLRVELGMQLYDLRERLDGDRTAVARLTGLNRSEQIRAEQIPFDHNWTLAQIERLALAISTTPKELISGSI